MERRARKLNGKFIVPRGSNKKYSQLDDLDEVYNLLLLHCPADVARMKGVPYNSLRYLIVKYLSPEQQANINWKRQPHSNKKKLK